MCLPLYATRPTFVAFAVVATCCARPVVPNPRTAALRYAQAVEAGDAQAVHALMTRASQLEYGERGVQRLLREAQAELKNEATALRTGPLTVDAEAILRFADGHRARLELEGGRFWIDSVQGLPARPTTPREALVLLGVALERQNHQTLFGALSKTKKASMERDRDSLLRGLREADAARIVVEDNLARAELTTGHEISLIREDGVWKVENLE